MASQAANIKISPVNVSWNIEETLCVDTKGVVSTALDAVYFNIYDTSTTYYVWFNLDAGSVDPAPAGQTAIEVAVTTGDSPATIAAAIETAVEAATGYVGDVSGTEITFVFNTTDVIATDAADVDSGMSILVVHKGGNLDLGLLDGTVEPSFAQETLDITAHQTGTIPITQLIQGFTLTLDLVLKECKKTSYKELLSAGGGSFTPAGGTEVVGWGKGAVGKNVLLNSRRLNLHPINESTEDCDLTLWLAFPVVSSIVYSGEEEQKLNVTFTAFLDDSKPDDVSLFVYGDSTQTGL